jgi:hypothetical protein
LGAYWGRAEGLHLKNECRLFKAVSTPFIYSKILAS